MCLDNETQSIIEDLGSYMIKRLALNESWVLVTSVKHKNEGNENMGWLQN